VSFFKKKKSKQNTSEAESQERQSRLVAEIEKMDQERHLDLQLEELTARLNRPVESFDTPKEDLPKESKISDPFLSESLKDFSVPGFTATLQSGVKNIDVTSEDKSDIPFSSANPAPRLEPTPAQDLSLEPSPEITASEDELPDVSHDVGLAGPQRLDMSEMRVDVAKISADIQSGEEL